MKTVLYLTPGIFEKGGISRYGRYQVRALREILDADAVSVLSLIPPDGRGFEDPIQVDFASFGSNPRGKVLFSLATVIASIRDSPGIIWSAHAHLAPLAAVMARIVRAKFILNAYGSEVWTHVTRLRRRAIRSADHIVSDCYATRDHLIQDSLHGADGISVHWDCVDLERFFPREPSSILDSYGIPPAGGAKTVMTLARLAAHEGHKGVDRLIEVFSKIPREVPVRLVVCGDGSQRPSLESLVASHGLSDRVFFTGFVKESDLPDVYRSCDLFSLITHKGPGVGEGIPLTPLEAAACGKPILVGNQDGSHEAVEDKVSGFVLDTFDLSSIGDHIRLLVENDDQRERMGLKARERIERYHGFEGFRDRIASILEGISD